MVIKPSNFFVTPPIKYKAKVAKAFRHYSEGKQEYLGQARQSSFCRISERKIVLYNHDWQKYLADVLMKKIEKRRYL